MYTEGAVATVPFRIVCGLLFIQDKRRSGLKRVGFGFLGIVIVLTCPAFFFGVSDSLPQGVRVSYFVLYILFCVYMLFLYPKKIRKRMQNIHKETQVPVASKAEPITKQAPANITPSSIKNETAVIGIDLGTTNSLVALWKEGQVELIPNSLSHIMTPSVVGVDDDGSILVGEIAGQRRISHPDFTAAEFKRNMGADTKYVLGKKKYLPEELSAVLLKKLVEDAMNQTGAQITEAVISVPAYFDNNQREATKRAAKLAGLEVKRLINEPSAAILYHRWKAEKTGTEGLYLVIDFGGGTLDVSVVDCFENIIEIIAVAGNNQLGGKDFDRAIAEDFCRKNGLEFELLRKSVRENLLWTAESVKRALTNKESVTMRIVIEEKKYEADYDTNELLKVSAEILVKMKAVLKEALQGAKVGIENITDVILVGGSCKMPVVQRYLSAFFHRAVTVEGDSDFMVAYGTGVLTGIVGRESDISDIVMADVCPFSLGTGVQRYIGKGKYAFCMDVMIPKNSILPIAKTKVFSGTSPNQKKMWIDILQGEEEYALGNLFLGEVQIDVTPDSEGRTEAEVTFCYDINGVLEVKVRDVYGNHTAETVVVSRHSGLSPEEIEKKRIDINSEHRFEKNKEENRSVIAWGQRLYAQANNEQKKILADIIADFESAVERNDMIMVRRKRPKLLKQLAELEQLINRDYFDNEDIIARLLEDEQ